MAEERLIDDDLDKDKKYKIRTNEDGEDELFIDETVEETPAYETGLEICEQEEDDEDAPALPPEVFVARERERREREARERQAARGDVEKALNLYAQGDREGALKEVLTAEKLDPHSGDVCAAKLKILSDGFKDFSDIDGLVSTSAGVLNYCSDSQKQQLADISAPLKTHIEELEESAAAMHVEVEEKKAERREVFQSDRKKWIMIFTAFCVPFIASFIIAVAFASVMHARQDGLNIIITIVFASLAAVFFIAVLFTSKKMWTAMKKVSLNEKNSSTKLGREYEDTLATITKLKTVLNSFKDTE